MNAALKASALLAPALPDVAFPRDQRTGFAARIPVGGKTQEIETALATTRGGAGALNVGVARRTLSADLSFIGKLNKYVKYRFRAASDFILNTSRD